jgi:cytochrome c
MQSPFRNIVHDITRSIAVTAEALALSVFCLAGNGNVHAAAYPGCSAPTDGEFKMTNVVSQSVGSPQEPLRMAFDMSASGDVDIYFVEKAGKVRKYDGAAKSVSTIGTVGVNTTWEHGLLGIALDPAFKTNKRLYLYYGTNQNPYQFRISRFTLTGGQMDMASEKIMIRIPADFNSWHTGGAMRFDVRGDLWVTVGDNKSDEGGSPNSNSLLGKILRIHPLDDGTYSIPAGNLFPVGTDKTKPEIYIMGNRNPYSISLDPQTGWTAWGEVGPDGFGQTEEFNLASKPGNYGWPYFAGNNMVIKSGKSPDAPVNNSPLNTGLVNLPPAIPATYAYNQACAITGPVYRYNSVANSPVKMPPQFDGVWFVTDFNNYGAIGQTLDTMSIDANGKPGKFGRVFPAWKMIRPIEFQMGPDGALYVVNYAGYFTADPAASIVRIEYTGTCRPAVTTGILRNPSGSLRSTFEVQGSRIAVNAESDWELKVRDLEGKTWSSQRGRGPLSYDLRSLLGGRTGLYVATLGSEGAAYSEKFLLP